MTTLSPYLLGALTATLCGLDRTAALQVMISRPLVAAALTGLLLGDLRSGLAIGVLLELLWLSRLPVGASVPHDDTQLAIGATVLAIALSPELPPAERGGFCIFCVLIVLPLGKIGQRVEHSVRNRNARLQERAAAALQRGETTALERIHLAGLLNFALAALLTYGAIVLVGTVLVQTLAPLFLAQTVAAAPWLRLVLILVAVGALLRTLHVKNAFRLFTVAFLAGLLIFRGLP